MKGRKTACPPAGETKRRRRRAEKKKNIWRLFFTVLTSVVMCGLLTLGAVAWLQSEGNGQPAADGSLAGAQGSVPGDVEETEKTKTAAEGGPEKERETAEGSDVLARIEKEQGHFWEQESTEVSASRYGEILADAAKMQEMNAVAVESGEDGSVTLAFAGDILFDDNYSPMVRLKQRGGDIASCFSKELMWEMKEADVFVVNNEFTYTGRGVPTEGKQYTFRARPETVSYLKELSVDAAMLANNHAYDYGEISLTDTLDTLKEAGIPYAGAGRDLEEAAKPLYLMTEELKIALVNATQIERQDHPDTKGAAENTAGVFRCWNPERLYETVRRAKEESDFVIVYIHWGTEGTTELDWAQREQAAGLAEAGADLIIGDHPHCLQEIAYVDQIPVVYSLGNYWFNSRPLDTCLLKAVVTDKGLKSLQFLPARQEDCFTGLLDGGEAQRVIHYMNGLSATAVIDEEGYVQKK